MGLETAVEEERPRGGGVEWRLGTAWPDSLPPENLSKPPRL